MRRNERKSSAKLVDTSWGLPESLRSRERKPDGVRVKAKIVPRGQQPQEPQTDPLDYYLSVSGVMAGGKTDRMYFSRKNLEHIQRMIISRAYNESRGLIRIGPQNEQTIMDHMIEEYMKYPYEQAFQPVPDPHPMQTINGLVVDAIMPELYAGIRQYINFQKAEADLKAGTFQSKMEYPTTSARAIVKDEKTVNTHDPGENAGPIRGCGPRHLQPLRYRVLNTPTCDGGRNTEGQEYEEKHEWQDIAARYIRVATKGQI